MTPATFTTAAGSRRKGLTHTGIAATFALLAAGFSRAATFNAATPAELIASIASANDETAHPGPDVITLSPVTFSFADAAIWDFGPNALPVITSDITIEGQN